jgi:tRNA threonylcarbamoyladenosine biosynthesis protein TsaB
MDQPISIAIETSSRRGSVALGAGKNLLRVVDFQADQRHATQLILRLDELLTGQNLRPKDIQEVYISIGPGSFTGLRVGITVARTLAQAISTLRCLAVPTANVVAQNAANLDFENLAVLMDAKNQVLYVSCFRRVGGRIVPSRTPELMELSKLADFLPKPCVIAGEAMLYYNVSGAGITAAPAELYYPTADSLWRVGSQLSEHKEVTEINAIRPLYLRKPEAVRLWENRHKSQCGCR